MAYHTWYIDHEHEQFVRQLLHDLRQAHTTHNQARYDHLLRRLQALPGAPRQLAPGDTTHVVVRKPRIYSLPGSLPSKKGLTRVH